ncbi:MAG TPA: peptide chain release factor 2 [bacterium]|jgi:peptide chain release factor 2|nr:peptide chain release factor 2 [bacterium]MDX9806293.1 peptide chain release factor 2 [bacterium]HNW16735.1 peptide chain release factor 2 [bacterium]HPM47364.1 peptide chain release factor 2 [bacterium]HQI04846.1 peptide chain release factor 2 [bacterium]
MALNLRELEQITNDIAGRAGRLSESLKIDSKRNRLKELDNLLNSPEIWNDSLKMAALNKEKRAIQNSIVLFDQFESKFDELKIARELFEEDSSMEPEAQKVLDETNSILDRIEFQKMLGGKTDILNAIVSINAGAGGRESQDWAVMLFRMYTRWCERKGYKLEIIDKVTGDDAAGIKNVTLIAEGDYAHGYLKAEIGVHRLVRISPYDANKRRHTSFASVFVTPEIDDSIEVEIDEKDLKVDTFRSGGAGGQHVNTTDSAIRITHLPTGIVTQCQNERSQHKNRATAMKILRSKLYEFEMKKKMEAISENDKQKMGIDFGSQIRSYVLHPYKMVKDHRTDFETGNAEAVLDGEEILDKFMEDYLLKTGKNNEK